MGGQGTRTAGSGELASGCVESLTESLSVVPDGGIVSKTLAKQRAGSLTVFGFAAGQGLSEHSAPFDAFVVVLEGRLRISIGGDELHVPADGIVRMPANVPHALEATEKSRMLLVMLRDAEEE